MSEPQIQKTNAIPRPPKGISPPPELVKIAPQAAEVAPATVEVAKTGSDIEARLKVANDYLSKSLEKQDPLEANLGSVNSGLIRVAVQLDETLRKAIESGPRTLEFMHQLEPSIELVLKLARQIGRFADVELRASKESKNTERLINSALNA